VRRACPGLRGRSPQDFGRKRRLGNTGAMGQDWPTPHHHEPHPLPRVEDLPVAWEGYDRERVQAAFDAFYRHIAQLDTTLRALESVDVFRQQAGDLRAELRSMRSAGWSPYPRGYALTPERSLFGSVPDAVPRIAVEVVFLVVVAAVVAVAKFSPLEIVAVMAGAVVITFLVEWIAARDRRGVTPIPATAPARQTPAQPVQAQSVPVAQHEAAVAVAEENPPATGELLPAAGRPDPSLQEERPAAEDGSGWAAFAEPAGPQPLTLMGALSVDEESPPVGESKKQPDEQPVNLEIPDVQQAEPAPEPETEAEPEPVSEQEPEPEQEPVADVTEADTGTIGKRRRLRRGKREDRPHEPPPVPAPKHVRVLPPPESAVVEAELPPWERGFDDTEERR
jgi:hypothetical protein